MRDIIGIFSSEAHYFRNMLGSCTSIHIKNVILLILRKFKKEPLNL